MAREAGGDGVLHIIIGVLVISRAVDLFNLGFKFVMGVGCFGEAMADAGVAMMFVGVGRAVTFDLIGVCGERRNGEGGNSK